MRGITNPDTLKAQFHNAIELRPYDPNRHVQIPDQLRKENIAGPRIGYLYADKGKVAEMARSGSIRWSGGGVATQGYQVGTFKPGLYATTIPPWSKNVRQADMAKAFYGHSAKQYFNGEGWIAFYMDQSWEKAGILDYTRLTSKYANYSETFTHFSLPNNRILKDAIDKTKLSPKFQNDPNPWIKYPIVAWGDTLIPPGYNTRLQPNAAELAQRVPGNELLLRPASKYAEDNFVISPVKAPRCPNRDSMLPALVRFLSAKEMPEWTSAKGTRRAFIARNYRILMLVGDNFGDFFDAYKGTLEERQTAFETNVTPSAMFAPTRGRRELKQFYAGRYRRDDIGEGHGRYANPGANFRQQFRCLPGNASIGFQDRPHETMRVRWQTAIVRPCQYEVNGFVRCKI